MNVSDLRGLPSTPPRDPRFRFGPSCEILDSLLRFLCVSPGGSRSRVDVTASASAARIPEPGE